jgi:peroxiredoxin Q/BCP
MLEVGIRAPDFTLPDAAGVAQSLAQLRSAGTLVLYFYPADFTPGCTKEACDLRDLHAQILKAGLRVVGVSPQPPETHAHFASEYSLPFTLLADVDKQVIRAYDVDGPLGFGVRRATYLIRRDGVITDAVLADVRISRHTEFVRKALAAR